MRSERHDWGRSRCVALWSLAAGLCLAVPTGAWAQPQPAARSADDPTDTDFIATTERDEDPLGIDVTTAGQLDRAADELARQQALAAAHPDLPREQGDVVSGIRPLRELAHTLEVRWEHGLQYVTATVTLSSDSRFAAEAAYRLPLPDGARVLSLALCEGERCVDGADAAEDAVDQSFTRRLAQEAAHPDAACVAQHIRDARGDALALRVAPLQAGTDLRIRVEYALEQPVRGGTVRLTLPARGYDPRAAPAQIRVQAPDLQLPLLPDPFQLDAWVPLELAAAYKPQSPTRHRMRAACGQQACERRWAAAPLTPRTRPVELWLLVDRSPSMEGPARGRVNAAIAALLASVPAGSRVRLGSFAANAHALTQRPSNPDALPLQALQRELLEPGEARTRLSSGLALALMHWPRTPDARLVVLSDSRLTTSDVEQRAAGRWHRQGIPSFLIHLDDAAPSEARSKLLREAGVQVIPVAAEAERAVVRGDVEPLVERLAQIVHTTGTGGLPPGEQSLSYSRARGRTRVRVPVQTARWLAPQPVAQFEANFAPRAEAGLKPMDRPLYRADAYLAAPEAGADATTALPGESVLGMLRDQLLPKARACLRTDRAGRADYAVHATFQFLLERQEILEARVEGQLEPALRSCLDEVLGALRVPFFNGRVRVRYPIYTERAPVAPQIELAPDTARQLDQLFERERPPQ